MYTYNQSFTGTTKPEIFSSYNDNQYLEIRDVIIVNISGQKFFISRGNMNRTNDNYLKTYVSLNRPNYKDTINYEQYFFDRKPQLFQYIVEWYRNGQIIFPSLESGILREEFLTELDFWNIKYPDFYNQLYRTSNINDYKKIESYIDDVVSVAMNDGYHSYVHVFEKYDNTPLKVYRSNGVWYNIPLLDCASHNNRVQFIKEDFIEFFSNNQHVREKLYSLHPILSQMYTKYCQENKIFVCGESTIDMEILKKIVHSFDYRNCGYYIFDGCNENEKLKKKEYISRYIKSKYGIDCSWCIVENVVCNSKHVQSFSGTNDATTTGFRGFTNSTIDTSQPKQNEWISRLPCGPQYKDLSYCQICNNEQHCVVNNAPCVHVPATGKIMVMKLIW